MTDQTEIIDHIVDGILAFLKKAHADHLLTPVVARLQTIVSHREQTGLIVSAVPLSSEDIAQAEKLLAHKINQPVKLINQVDRSIVGGLVIRYKDMVIDQSVAGKLSKLTEDSYEA